MRYLTGKTRLICVHGGTITPRLPNGKRSLVLEGEPALVEGDVLNATVACSGVPPGVPPCTRVTRVLSGVARDATVDGEAPLLETLMVATDAGFAFVDPATMPSAVAASARIRLPAGFELKPLGSSVAEAGETQEPQREDLSWIFIRVLERHTGLRIPGVRLWLQVGDGEPLEVMTDAFGEIRVPNVHPGSFSIAGISRSTMEEALPGWCDLVGAPVEAPDDEADLALVAEVKPFREGEEYRYAFAGIEGPLDLAVITPHRVQDGETLTSIAKAYGTQEEVIAMFNWGTLDPTEIGFALRDDVGCAVSQDGGLAPFSAADEPGYVFVPQPWNEGDLETGQPYRILIQLSPAYRFSLENEAGDPIPEIAYSIRFADDSVQSDCRLSARGRGLHLNPYPGPVEVIYTQPEQIIAHDHARRLALWLAVLEEQSANNEALVEHEQGAMEHDSSSSKPGFGLR
jgi:hypothetical protein